jgi:hypothetical protein
MQRLLIVPVSIAPLLFSAAVNAEDDVLTIVGKLTSKVELAENLPEGPAASFSKKGNIVNFPEMEFVSIESDGAIGKLSNVGSKRLATVKSTAVLRGVEERTSYGTAGMAEFTKVEVDYGSDGQIDLTLDEKRGRGGPSTLFMNFKGRRGKIPTNGAIPVVGMNRFEGYAGTIFFAGSIDPKSTEVIITCILQREG